MVRIWEVFRGVLVTIVSAAIISSAVSLYQIASSSGPFFGGVPEGAVLAFNRQECPNSWTAYDDGEGRFIVGVGAHTLHNAYGNKVPTKELGEKSGEDRVLLEIDHMPNHFHYNPTQGSTGQGRYPALAATDHGNEGARGMEHSRPTSEQGESQPHNNMPPYVALLFCEKE